MINELMNILNFDKETIKEINELDNLINDSNYIYSIADDLISSSKDYHLYAKKLMDYSTELSNKYNHHLYTLELYILLYTFIRVKPKYDELNIPYEVYIKNAFDLKWKLKECQDVYGVNGTFVGEWYSRFFIPDRYALGRLQFELETFKEDSFNNDGLIINRNDTVINIHVPSEGPLTKDGVDDAIKQARKYIGNYPIVIDSYLLDPDLYKCFSSDSNLKAFADRFNIIKVRKTDSFNDAWRIFNTFDADINKYKEDTSLRRNVKKALLEGVKFGHTYAVIKEDKEYITVNDKSYSAYILFGYEVVKSGAKSYKEKSGQIKTEIIYLLSRDKTLSNNKELIELQNKYLSLLDKPSNEEILKQRRDISSKALKIILNK